MPSEPGLEVITGGSQVYNKNGDLLWQGDCTKFSAVADLDRDGSPELVCTATGTVKIYASDGTLKASKPIPTEGDRNNGGAPNIGNFYGDENLEIGLAGGYYYVVFDKDLNIKWKMETDDTSSSSTGSTIFDLNGDGKVEVRDSYFLTSRLLTLDAGVILWETANPSGTLWEYPLVVNLDDHPSAEIIVSAPGLGGVRAFRDPTGRWVEARPVWNQYSYYPEIVDDDLIVSTYSGIPSGFRINSQGSLITDPGKIYLPDLTIVPDPADIEVDENTYMKEVFIINTGEASMPAGAVLEIVDKDSSDLIEEIPINEEIEAGRYVNIMIGPLSYNKSYILSINLNPDGSSLVEECDDSNNSVYF